MLDSNEEERCPEHYPELQGYLQEHKSYSTLQLLLTGHKNSIALSALKIDTDDDTR